MCRLGWLGRKGRRLRDPRRLRSVGGVGAVEAVAFAWGWCVGCPRAVGDGAGVVVFGWA